MGGREILLLGDVLGGTSLHVKREGPEWTSLIVEKDILSPSSRIEDSQRDRQMKTADTR